MQSEKPRIITNNVYPPIPDRQFDWSAVRDGYEPGCPVGRGPTEEAAIADLLAMEADREDAARAGIKMDFA